MLIDTISKETQDRLEVKRAVGSAQGGAASSKFNDTYDFEGDHDRTLGELQSLKREVVKLLVNTEEQLFLDREKDSQILKL